ncbi:MAG: hypothetical protein H7844_02700 [Nitrospirae bacterium YQR-1]
MEIELDVKNEIERKEKNLYHWVKVFEKALEDKHISDDEFLELNELEKRLGLTNEDTKPYWAKVYFPVAETKPLPPAVISKSIVDFIPEIPEWRLTVSFGKSSSNNFAQVLSSIQIHPGYQLKKGQNNEEIHELNFRAEEILQFEQLWSRVKTWKSTVVNINNEIIDRKDLSKWLICYRDKLKEKDTNPLFCFGASPYTYNLFGCHRTMIRDGAGTMSMCWYDMGKFINNNVFQIDKEAIAAMIIKEIYPYRICPALRRDKIVRGYNIIPTTIDISQQKEWATYYDYGRRVKKLIPQVKYIQRKISEVSSGNFSVSISAYMSIPDYEDSISPQFKQILYLESRK